MNILIFRELLLHFGKRTKLVQLRQLLLNCESNFWQDVVQCWVVFSDSNSQREGCIALHHVNHGFIFGCKKIMDRQTCTNFRMLIWAVFTTSMNIISVLIVLLEKMIRILWKFKFLRNFIRRHSCFDFWAPDLCSVYKYKYYISFDLFWSRRCLSMQNFVKIQTFSKFSYISIHVLSFLWFFSSRSSFMEGNQLQKAHMEFKSVTIKRQEYSLHCYQPVTRKI